MPFKSRAQRRKFAELLVQGKITADTFEEWNRETGRAKLPERVERKRTRKRKATAKKRKATAKRRTTAKRKRSAASSRKRTR